MKKWAFSCRQQRPGLPLWLPKGTVLVEKLEQWAKETEFAAGCIRVRTPHLAREKMYKTSGHLPDYAESMFPKMEMDEHRADRQQIQERIAELEKLLADDAKKKTAAEIQRKEF